MDADTVARRCYQYCHQQSAITHGYATSMNTPVDPSTNDIAYVPASVARRVGALIYDAMLVLAVLAVATIPFVVCIQVFNLGKVLVPSDVGWLIYGIYLGCQLLVMALFFGFFWTRRGQTLGMQVWKLRVEDEDGRLLSWTMAIKRLMFATLLWLPGLICLALSEQLRSLLLKRIGEVLLVLVLANLVPVMLYTEGLSWHDRMSRSRVVRAATASP